MLSMSAVLDRQDADSYSVDDEVGDRDQGTVMSIQPSKQLVNRH
jgi:hypothetical protein